MAKRPKRRTERRRPQRSGAQKRAAPHILFLVRGEGLFNLLVNVERVSALSPAATQMLAGFDEPFVALARDDSGRLGFRGADEIAAAHEEPEVLTREATADALGYLIDAWQVDEDDLTASAVEATSRVDRSRMNDPAWGRN